MSKDIFDMDFEKFMPEIWSKTFIDKLYAQGINVLFESEHIMVQVAKRIEKLRGDGLSNDEIKKDIEGYIAGIGKDTIKIRSWKTWSDDAIIHS